MIDWDAFARFRDGFSEAMDPRLCAITDLERLIASGQAHFMAAGDAAIVFEVKTWPSGARAVHGLVAAGNLDRIVGLLIPSAEAWGVAHGCTLAIIESRDGWGRALAPSGYEPFQSSIAKDL